MIVEAEPMELHVDDPSGVTTQEPGARFCRSARRKCALRSDSCDGSKTDWARVPVTPASDAKAAARTEKLRGDVRDIF